MPQFPQYL